MLMVNCPKPDVVKELFDGQTIEGMSFDVVSIQGFSTQIRHTGDAQAAKVLAKRVLAEAPALKYKVANVMVVDEEGRVI